ncbi:MAG TPA: hypothetical protein VF185_03015 [Patescibacteria group bacterium]
MAERIFLVEQPREYEWSNYIIAHEFEAPDGVGGAWLSTGRGSHGLVDSVPGEIAAAIEPDDNLVFAFAPGVSHRNQATFREGFVKAVKDAKSEKGANSNA